MSNPPAAAPRGRFLRMEDLAGVPAKEGRPATPGMLGLSQATINRLHRAGEFPPKRQLSARAVGWWESDIEEWMASRETVNRRA